MTRSFGLFTTVLNLAVWIYFHRHVVTLLPRRHKWLRVVSPLAFVMFLHPALVLTFGGRPGMLALRQISPLPLSLLALAAQFGSWVCVIARARAFDWTLSASHYPPFHPERTATPR